MELSTTTEFGLLDVPAEVVSATQSLDGQGSEVLEIHRELQRAELQEAKSSRKQAIKRRKLTPRNRSKKMLLLHLQRRSLLRNRVQETEMLSCISLLTFVYPTLSILLQYLSTCRRSKPECSDIRRYHAGSVHALAAVRGLRRFMSLEAGGAWQVLLPRPVPPQVPGWTPGGSSSSSALPRKSGSFGASFILAVGWRLRSRESRGLGRVGALPSGLELDTSPDISERPEKRIVPELSRYEDRRYEFCKTKFTLFTLHWKSFCAKVCTLHIIRISKPIDQTKLRSLVEDPDDPVRPPAPLRDRMGLWAPPGPEAIGAPEVLVVGLGRRLHPAADDGPRARLAAEAAVLPTVLCNAATAIEVWLSESDLGLVMRFVNRPEVYEMPPGWPYTHQVLEDPGPARLEGEAADEEGALEAAEGAPLLPQSLIGPSPGEQYALFDLNRDNPTDIPDVASDLMSPSSALAVLEERPKSEAILLAGRRYSSLATLQNTEPGMHLRFEDDEDAMKTLLSFHPEGDRLLEDLVAIKVDCSPVDDDTRCLWVIKFDGYEETCF
eukprot:g15627.t1